MTTRHDQGDAPQPATGEGGEPTALLEGQPGETAEAATEPRRAGGGRALKAVAALVVLGAVGGLAGYAAMPLWRDHVPPEYRGFLPAFPEEDRRLGEMAATIDGLRRDLGASAGAVRHLAGTLTELEQRLARLESAPSAPAIVASEEPATDPAVMARLDQLESKLAANDTGTLAKRTDRLETRIEEVTGRVDTVAKGQIGPSTMVAVFDRIAAVEETARKAASRQDSALALTLAVAQLRDAVYRGAPFEAELQTVKALTDDVAAVDQAVAGFAAYSQKGMPTRAALARRFETLPTEVAQAAVAPDGSGWMDKTAQRLMAVVTVRRTDGAAAGDSAVAVMARAGALMLGGDLAGTVVEMQALSGATARVVETWLADARARVAADDGLSALTARALGRSAASRTGG